MPDVNVLCVKWGTKYPADYVNRLHSMVKRHLHQPHRFVCLTDDASGLDPQVETKPLTFPDLSHAWTKLNLYADPLFDLSGTALYLDLDVVIVDDVDEFIEHRKEEPILSIVDWQRPYTFNSSIVRYAIGRWSNVVEDFRALRQRGVLVPSKLRRFRKEGASPGYVDKRPNHRPRNYRHPGLYPGDQQWLTDNTVTSGPHRRFCFPENWAISFKNHCMRWRRWKRVAIPNAPDQAKIVVFHGRPHPHEVDATWIHKHWC